MKSKTFEERLGNSVRSNQACRKQSEIAGEVPSAVYRGSLPLLTNRASSATRENQDRKQKKGNLRKKKKIKLNSDPEQ